MVASQENKRGVLLRTAVVMAKDGFLVVKSGKEGEGIPSCTLSCR